MSSQESKRARQNDPVVQAWNRGDAKGAKSAYEKQKKELASKKKAYTGHYQEGKGGRITHQSPKQVKDKNLGTY